MLSFTVSSVVVANVLVNHLWSLFLLNQFRTGDANQANDGLKLDKLQMELCHNNQSLMSSSHRHLPGVK